MLGKMPLFFKSKRHRVGPIFQQQQQQQLIFLMKWSTICCIRFWPMVQVCRIGDARDTQHATRDTLDNYLAFSNFVLFLGIFLLMHALKE